MKEHPTGKEGAFLLILSLPLICMTLQNIHFDTVRIEGIFSSSSA